MKSQPMRHAFVSAGGSVSQSRVRRRTVCCAGPDPARFFGGLFRVDQERDKEIAKVALPALGTLLVEPLLSAVDTAFVGRIGVSELGGVGVSTILLRGTFALFNFLAASTTPLVAASRGNVSQVVAESTIIAFFIGTVIAVALHFAGPAALAALAGATSSSVVPHAVVYTRWRAWAAPALLAGFVLSGAFRGMRDTMTPLWVALFSNLVNVALDYITIYLLHWGVMGAALATSISQVLNTLLLLGVLLWRKVIKSNDFGRLPSARTVREIAFGAVLSIRTVSILATFTASGRLAALGGTVMLAAYEVARQVWVFQAFVLDALAVAAQSLVSNFLAEGNIREARMFCSRLLQIGLLSGLVLGAAVYALAGAIPALFVPSAAAQGVAATILRSFAPLQPVCALVFVYDGIFIAARDFQYTAKSIFFAGLVSWLALYCVTAFGLVGPGTIWMGINVLVVGRAVALGSRYLSEMGPIPPSAKYEDADSSQVLS